jgi:dGTPase
MPAHARQSGPPPADYGAGLAPGERDTASYAATAVPSRGRRHVESDCPTRSPFQRDRDRILHSTAFRRLMHKTQVFVVHEGDHYRTRLTHSLEVAQIARTIARQLRLDEDLAEALALAHDLGHPPFGHAGERALDRLTADIGGFDHNAQSLRVVMALERKYAAFDGLNLTWETLEGLAKHNGPVTDASHPVARIAADLESWQPLPLNQWPSAEAQVAAIADDIAYGTHDIDDGLRAGLIGVADLAEVPLAARTAALSARVEDPARRIYEITRTMITKLIADVVAESRVRLAGLAPETPDHIREAEGPVVGFSSVTGHEMLSLKSFLFKRVYRHPRVMDVMGDAERIVEDLYVRYTSDPAALPSAWAGQHDARRVADFVAGMTDRYAMAEHRRLA